LRFTEEVIDVGLFYAVIDIGMVVTINGFDACREEFEESLALFFG
jgi:hypothetical protein